MATRYSHDGEFSKYFNPNMETITEFLERFKLQNLDKVSSSQDSKDTSKLAMHLANVLPVFILLVGFLHFKLAPSIAPHIICAVCTKKSIFFS